MIRVTAWTAGLFVVGCAICHFFPGPFVEPLVLLALGTTLFLVSGRAATSQREDEGAHHPDDVTTSTPTRAAR